MAIERKFVKDSLTRYKVSEFLRGELERAGFSGAEIQRTPVVTRIAVEVTHPGRVIGKRGKSIKELTEKIHKKFNMDNPQISVIECAEPLLKPVLVAKRACMYIERGKKIRPVMHRLLSEIMSKGAIGVEIVASGKLAGKGGRARTFRVVIGFVPKAGEPARLVNIGHYTAYPKAGAIGVTVRIVPPGTRFPDKTYGDDPVEEKKKTIKALDKPIEKPSQVTAVKSKEAATTTKKKIVVKKVKKKVAEKKVSAPTKQPKKKKPKKDLDDKYVVKIKNADTDDKKSVKTKDESKPTVVKDEKVNVKSVDTKDSKPVSDKKEE